MPHRAASTSTRSWRLDGEGMLASLQDPQADVRLPGAAGSR